MNTAISIFCTLSTVKHEEEANVIIPPYIIQSQTVAILTIKFPSNIMNHCVLDNNKPEIGDQNKKSLKTLKTIR